MVVLVYYVKERWKYMTVGENIKRMRKEHGLTQEELGKKIDVSGVAIMRYEKGQREPKLETIEKIANALEVSSYELQGITSNDILKSLSDTTSFYNYLHALGYEIYESPYNDKWEITIKESGQKIYINSAEMNILESTTKENIDLRISKYISDGKHNQ